MPTEQPKPPAPYLPWKTFLNSFDVFSQATPPRIHRTLWKQSGLMQGLLMGAYRFFGLMDNEDRPTDVLIKVTKSPIEQRPMLVGELLRSAYPEIMAHDLTTMTIPILHELIEKYNVSGSTRKKAVTFFLQAAKYAKVPLSNFIQTRNSGMRRRRSRNGEEFSDNNLAVIARPQDGEKKTVELGSGGTVTLTVSVDFLSLHETDRRFVFDLVDKLKSYSPPPISFGSVRKSVKPVEESIAAGGVK